MKTSELRARFIKFFKDKAHTIVKSDSLIPTNDPTVLFTGAGMNQFKDYFLGLRRDLKRAATSQKCLRTGDLDVVGKTPYHHSFFEMLGNFSFGDYFKKEAIQWAWDFLTKELNLPPDRLCVSVHEGDDEAFQIWSRDIGIPERLIARLGDHTNFWPADAPKLGPNGPCGPCSEIFFDQGKSYPGSKKGLWVEDQSGRFAEIWNLVFTQFERVENGKLTALKAKNIDTGMGLERLACILQGKKTNYEIDIFEPLLTYLIRKAPSDKMDRAQVNAIADHIRAAVVAIADGAHPSNESRGYVVRKLIRRAIWKGRVLGLKFPLLAPMVPLVIKTLEDAYPELRQAEKSVTQTIDSEEKRFLDTLESGLKVVSKLVREAKTRKNKQLNGTEVFQLYDTYGFPDELTRTIAKEANVGIDEEQFSALLEGQRLRAKEASKIRDTIFAASDVNQELVDLRASNFLGYETTEAEGQVQWLHLKGNQGVIALNQTPFYPEGGGQVGDAGSLESRGFKFIVKDTQKLEGVILHYGELLKGKPKVKDKCRAIVDRPRREATKRNHTATHLLQSALRSILGTHVRQVGSLVNPDKLRFDFTHGKPLTSDEIKATEAWVNQAALESQPVKPKQERYDTAIKTGALAFFGDKYTDQVRTITITGRSKELCGGTHCRNTGEIGGFVITSESSVGSGTRRIEAITGLNTIEYVRSLQETLLKASAKLKATPEQMLGRVEQLCLRVREFERAREQGVNNQRASIDLDQVIQSARTIGSVHLISQTFSDMTLPSLRSLADRIRSMTKQTVLALFAKNDSKVNVVIALTKDLNRSALDAKKLSDVVVPFLSGSAGGRKDLAQGGGRNASGIDEASRALEKYILQMVG